MRGRFLSLGAVLLFTFGPLLGDDGEEASSRLTLERIYESNEFQAEGFSGRWLPKGGYATLETAAGGPGARPCPSRSRDRRDGGARSRYGPDPAWRGAPARHRRLVALER